MSFMVIKLKAKAVPLHATKAFVGIGVLVLILDLGTRWG
jgi:hypothetical protein